MTARAAATVAGKRATAAHRETKRAKAAGVSAKRSGGIRRPLSPANPRRVSGPAHGRSSDRAAASARPAPAATARAATARASTARASTATGRVASTARAAAAAGATAMAVAAEVAPRIVRPAPRITRPERRGAPATATRGARALAFVRGLPDHSLTDRLVRGRAWIPILGVLLVGIVALQVSILRLNASMGRAIEQSTTLQTQNGELRAQVASLGSVARIERLASGMGMVMSTPAQISFLSPRASGLRSRAIANMTAPTSSALGTVGAAASSATSATTGTTTAASTSISSTSASASTPPVAPTTSAATQTSSAPPGTATPAAGSYPATGGTAPTTAAATGPAGAAAPPSATAGATGAVGPAQQSSGGASSGG
jgi:cell division protein FtsL